MNSTRCKNGHLFTEESTYIRPDTGHRQCKVCQRDRLRRWRKDNPETARDYDRKWLKKNLEERRKQKRKSHNKHREKNNDRSREWRVLNPDRLRKNTLQWHANNPTKQKEYSQNRRAREVGQRGYVSSNIDNVLMEKQKGKCYYCQALLTDTGFHREHKIPLIRGGLHQDENLVLSCPPCNFKKNTKTDVEFKKLFRKAV